MLAGGHDNLNITRHLRANALAFPDDKALFYARGSDDRGAPLYGDLTFSELEKESDRFAFGLRSIGITKGTKTILMVKPGPELLPVIFALFKVGAIPVMVDPGMGIGRMLHCFQAVGAEAFIGIPVAHVVRSLFKRKFSTVTKWVTVGRRWFWGGPRLKDLALDTTEPFPIVETSASDLLVINFTTGSTGPAKGVEYTHGMADAILSQLSTLYALRAGDVMLATLPLFALLSVFLKMPTILPPMDPTKPALVDSRKMIQTIEAFQVTHMFASPAFLHRVGEFAHQQGSRLPSLRVVIAGGAPVASSIVNRFRELLSEKAELHTTYGATEALPITTIEAGEIQNDTQQMTREGLGTCVGRPVEDLEIRIIHISDEPIAHWSEALLVPQGEVGEITISGPMVSKSYHRGPQWNNLMKIHEENRIWHRTGDLGWVDTKGRLWFCGRKSERIITQQGTLYSVQWEGVFNAHPQVYRSALVGVGPQNDQRPVVCIELQDPTDEESKERIGRELRQMARNNRLTHSTEAFLFHPSFPVDIRHNAKIERGELGRWAAESLKAKSGAPRKKHWLKLVPILGWLFIIIGIIYPFQHLALRVFWLIDIVLSVGVHGLQLFVALPKGKRAGYSTFSTIFLTILYGATWWRELQPRPLLITPSAPPVERKATA